jgi:hypothetical protein
MANKNFVVHNGLEVGPVTIFSGNGDIVSSGNITSTNSASIATIAVTKYVMQFPDALGSATWYKLGTFSVNSGVGAGETVEITVTAGSGYGTDSIAKDVINVRILSGSGTNVQANYYSQGFKEAISGVKVKSVNSIATDTSWDIFVYVNTDLGKGFAEVKVSNDAKFQWVNTSTTDPGSASSTLLVATNKLVTSTANVVIASGNLYVGGNIFQGGSQVSTTVASGLITSVIQGNDSSGPFSLSNTPADINQISVWWNGIYQPKNTYSLAGNQLTFTEAIPTGSNVEVKILAGSGVSALGTLADIDFTNAPANGQFLQYDSATSKWSAGSSTSLQVVQNTALVYAVALGGF